MNKHWWKETIVYQIYPRSFQDSNNDGIGDLRGIINRLDYIADLGVETLWLNPIYASPNKDNGYDVSNYKAIMPEFGTIQDFDELVQQAQTKGLKIILDLIPNHSSNQHQWFTESSKSKNNPYRDYYFWKAPNPDGSAPTNWKGFFHPNTWTFDERTQEYYLHLFSPHQPDLNWENPKVRQEIYNIMHFWMQKGIHGFRIDVLTFISKNLQFPNQTPENYTGDPGAFFGNGPRLHEFLQEMHQEVLQHYDMMTVGEGAGINPQNAHLFVAEQRKELHTIYHFDQMGLDKEQDEFFSKKPYSLVDFKAVVQQWDKLTEQGGWNTCYLGNHDFPRIVSRFGNDKQYRVQSAKLLAMYLLSQRATPYLYFGDEIGMTNSTHWDSLEDYRDIHVFDGHKRWIAEGKNEEDFIAALKHTARDHSRTPMQWDNTTNAGFSKAEPWIQANPNYKEINVESEMNNPDSTLNFYKKLIAIRKENPCLINGDYQDLLPLHDSLYVYKRSNQEQRFLVILNFSDHQVKQSINLNHYQIIINNYPQLESDNQFVVMQPWQAVLLCQNH